jgi:hypothetical protein
MGSVRIELNGAGIRSLLGSAEVQEMLERKAEAVADAARARDITVGPVDGGSDDIPLPVTVVPRKGSRARVLVAVDHPAAIAAEAKYRVLGSALNAAR